MTIPELTWWNISVSGLFSSMNSRRFLVTEGGGESLLNQGTLSFPRKLNSTEPPFSLTCSTLKVLAPTVSASSSSFSSPTLIPSVSIR